MKQEAKNMKASREEPSRRRSHLAVLAKPDSVPGLADVTGASCQRTEADTRKSNGCGVGAGCRVRWHRCR